ncbi:radical SAM protein [Oceanicoccus sp. KOV_DT_Chl]|uniref:radical SAM protein n=1 Tax=Oceanicoccus sp. KOV_DT_Chl TaxID=1904639 RepID=UPI000C7ACB2A|nr:radical SAM protein [Oceanicoccus sp. KOV_DT_Chl]
MSGPLQMAQAIGDYLITKRMKHMIVHVTNACNFRCDHCFVDFEGKKRDLKLADYQQLAADSESLMWLDIAGGEPFLRKDLADIVCAFDAKIVHIPTNGSLIPQMISTLREIKERSDCEIIIGLSLDGLQDSHDRIRKVPGSYEQVWEAYEALREISGVSVKVCTVINNENLNEILPLMEEVQSRGADFHSVILLRGETLDPNVRLPTLVELRSLESKMFEVLSRYDYGRSSLSAHILRNFHRNLWDISLKTLEQRTQVIPCLAGQTQLVVNGDGTVSSCEMLPAVGNIKDNRLPDIISSDAYQEQVNMIKNKGCHCTHNCAMLDSIFFNPANLPSLLFSRA